MLRSGLICAGFGAAASLLAIGGCSGDSLPALPTLPEIAEALTPTPVVGPPTDIYARVARGAMSCWFGRAGPLKARYLYHAEAKPASQGGKAKIVIHERNDKPDKPLGIRAFRIVITPEGETSMLQVENFNLPGPLAKGMKADVYRWAAGAVGCSGAGGDWSPKPPEPAEQPETWKTRAKKRGDT